MASDDFQRHPLFFAGQTWDDVEVDWNDHDAWAKAYPEDLSELDPDELKSAGRLGWGNLSILECLASELGLPPEPGRPPLRVLDAGCGESALPYTLARLGCDVTAIDFAAGAARMNEVLLPHRPTGPLEPTVVEALGDRAARVGQPGVPAGGVTHRTLDWFDEALDPGSFQAIYASNSLRLSRKPYWRRSLARFADLLEPGGLLVVLCNNAIAVRGEVYDLADAAGFRLESNVRGDQPEPPRRPEDKRFIGIWPTG